MILSPSTRFLIHILAVFCLTYRVVLSEDADLLDAVVAANDAAKDATTADPTESTTEWISASTAGYIECELSKDDEKGCVQIGTTTACEPCDGIPCDIGNATCQYDKATCKSPQCVCDLAIQEIVNDVCVDRFCGVGEKDVCWYNETKLVCDPCNGFPCNIENTTCTYDKSKCEAQCVCGETQKFTNDKDPVCVDRTCSIEKNKQCMLDGTEIQCNPCDTKTCPADQACHNTGCDTLCDCTDALKIKKDGICVNRACQLSTNKCLLEGTQNTCDPCDGVVCGADKKCVSDKTTCATECICQNELMTINKDGKCALPCDAAPCQNKQPCKTTTTVPSKFICECSSDYDGTLCENIHNYCKDEHPAGCPLGAFECVFKGLGDYDCSCAGGHSLDNDTNTCTKVTQRLSVDLIFTQTYYSEAYNVEGSAERKTATDAIEAAMKDLYGALLISISYEPFTQGSLVAHYIMNMKMSPDGNPQQNVFDIMKYSTNCEAGNNPPRKCFGTLGVPHLPINGTTSEDLRCEDVFCPSFTQCVPVDQSDKSVSCTCMAGFRLKKTVVEDTGRHIDVCEDIDECKENKPCTGDQLCINNPGSFECVPSPCDKNPCPGNAVCSAIDHYAYDCQCEWIYIASDCGTPWPLILVIVSSVLLALLILAIIGLCTLFTRSKKGSSVIATTSF